MNEKLRIILIVFSSLLIWPILLCTHALYKKFEEKFSNEPKEFSILNLTIIISPQDLVNFVLVLPFFILFAIAFFTSGFEETGIPTLDLIFYLLIFVDVVVMHFVFVMWRLSWLLWGVIIWYYLFGAIWF